MSKSMQATALWDIYKRELHVAAEPRPCSCDILSILASQIRAYNAWVDHDPGPIFQKVTARDRTVADLLEEDLEALAELDPAARAIVGCIDVHEALRPIPNASVLTPPQARGQQHLLLFNTPLLHLINSTFSMAHILVRTYKTDDCMERYQELALSSDYNDLQVMEQLLLDTASLYEGRNLMLDNPKVFFFAPYDLCEQIIWVRRFILAHEIGHIALGHTTRTDTLGALPESSLPYIASRRDLEYAADAYALDLLLRQFDPARQFTNDEVYLAPNIINGVRLFFFILQLVAYCFNWQELSRTGYPHPHYRRLKLERAVHDHPVFRACPNLIEAFYGGTWWLYGLEYCLRDYFLRALPGHEEYLADRPKLRWLVRQIRHGEERRKCGSDRDELYLEYEERDLFFDILLRRIGQLRDLVDDEVLVPEVDFLEVMATDFARRRYGFQNSDFVWYANDLMRASEVVSDAVTDPAQLAHMAKLKEGIVITLGTKLSWEGQEIGDRHDMVQFAKMEYDRTHGLFTKERLSWQLAMLVHEAVLKGGSSE